MKKRPSYNTMVFFSQSGCFLPILAILNLLFGWIFLPRLYWIMSELLLIFLFFLNSYFMARKIISAPFNKNEVIDVEAEVIDEKKQENPRISSRHKEAPKD